MKKEHTKTESGIQVSEETLDALEELGLVLKSIYIRMKKEGYDLVDGKVVKVKENEQGKSKKSKRKENSEGNCERPIP